MTEPVNCTRCGQTHGRCAGHNVKGGPCGAQPKRGATVCLKHGGHAPQVQKAAERRRHEADAAAALATYGKPIDIDPAAALLQELHRTAGHVAWLGAIIAAAEQDDLVWSKSEETEGVIGDGGFGTQTKHKAGPSVWLDLYQKERKHLVEVSKVAIGADASGRVAAVFEQIGSTYVQLIDRVLERLDLTPAQRAAIPGVLVEELQQLPGGAL